MSDARLARARRSLPESYQFPTPGVTRLDPRDPSFVSVETFNVAYRRGDRIIAARDSHLGAVRDAE